MVIISTSAVEVSIQAVLPLSSTGAGVAGAAAVAAGAAVCAKAAAVLSATRASEAAARPVVFKVEGIVIELSVELVFAALERVAVCFAGTDAHRLVDAEDEDLAVADLAGLGRRRDGFDGLVDSVGADGDFDLDLRQEAHRV